MRVVSGCSAYLTRSALYETVLLATKKTPRCHVQKIAAGSGIGKRATLEMLYKLQHEDLMTLDDEEVVVTPEQRMRIAIFAVAQGNDPETVSRRLRWQEFESLADRILAREGYDTKTHFIFKYLGRRFEIDVLGAKEPLLLCIDCKHWQYGWTSSRIAAAVKNQLLRVTSLSQSYGQQESKLSTCQWKSVRMLPVLLTLADTPSRIVNGVPTVSALRFGTFLSEIDPWIEQLNFVDVKSRQTNLT